MSRRMYVLRRDAARVVCRVCDAMNVVDSELRCASEEMFVAIPSAMLFAGILMAMVLMS